MIAPKRIHFIGIGGIGMSGIAETLLNLGHEIFGSDLKQGTVTERLIDLGVTVYHGHAASHLQENIDIVVYSSAINSDNSEYKEALKRKIPLLKRAQILAEIMLLKNGITIAGTHGKTTTSSILASLFLAGGKDPTYVIGGILKDGGGNARVGKGDNLIVEADESDGTFLLYNPIISAITNIDDDHLDFYGSGQEINKAFIKFANKIPFYGFCLLNMSDPRVAQARKHIIKPVLTFSLKENLVSDFFLKNLGYGKGVSFELHSQQELIGNFEYPFPGEHNALNASFAIIIALKLGIEKEAIAKALKNFQGIKRRFDVIYQNELLTIIDDYAHHPTEISTTVEAARKSSDGKLIAIFEPHRFSRTKDSWKEFLHCFNGVDKVYLSPIFSAGESPLKGISHQMLARDINAIHPHLAESLSEVSAIEDVLKKVKEPTTVLSLGAGPISNQMRALVQQWKKK